MQCMEQAMQTRQRGKTRNVGKRQVTVVVSIQTVALIVLPLRQKAGWLLRVARDGGLMCAERFGELLLCRAFAGVGLAQNLL